VKDATVGPTPVGFARRLFLTQAADDLLGDFVYFQSAGAVVRLPAQVRLDIEPVALVGDIEVGELLCQPANARR